MSTIEKQYENAMVEASAAVLVLQRIENLTLSEFRAMTSEERTIVANSAMMAKHATAVVERVIEAAAGRRRATSFSELEREILEHRLDVPFAIYEALFDEERNDGNVEAVADACGAIQARLAANEWSTELSLLEKRILGDCVESSVFLASMLGTDTSDAEIVAALLATQALALKVSLIVNAPIHAPAEAAGETPKTILAESRRIAKRVAAQQRG